MPNHRNTRREYSPANEIMSAPNQTEKYVSNVLINLFQLDLEDEEESIFMVTLIDTLSEDGTGAITLLHYEDIRNIGANFPFYLVVEVKSLHFYLNHLQEQGLYSIDSSFD